MKHPGARSEKVPLSQTRWFPHAVCVFIIVSAACLLFYKHFYMRGPLMHIDMTFPSTVNRNMSLYTNTWWQYGSVQNIWNVQRAFWSLPLLGVAWLLRMSTALYLLVLFLGTFALAGVSMYAFAYRFLCSNRLGADRRLAPFAGAVLAAFVFMYNPWSISHLWPYFGYPAYAVMPLVFMLLVSAVKRPRASTVIALALLVSVASTGPICVIWLWFLIITYMLFNLAASRFSRESAISTVKVLIPTAAIYALVGAAWIFPYLGAQLADKPFVPSYAPTLSQSMLDTLSASNSVVNNVRLVSGWGMPVDALGQPSWWQALWFALPLLAIVGMFVLYRRAKLSRYALYWSILFAISVLLATGSSFILKKPYSYLVLRAPGASIFGWVFRAADRWLFYVPFFYALMAAVAVAVLLERRSRVPGVVAALLAGLLVLASFVPLAYLYANRVFDPTQVPEDYNAINEHIEEEAPGLRPVRLPFSRDGFRYSWAPYKRIGAFDVYSSNPSLNNLQDIYARESYYYWLEDVLSKVSTGSVQLREKQLTLGDDIVSKLLAPFSAEFMVFDRSVPGYRSEETFNRDRSLVRTNGTDILDLYALDRPVDYIRAATSYPVVSTFFDNLSLSRALSPSALERVAFVNGGEDLAGVKTERLDDNLETINYNPGFDDWSGGSPTSWTLVNPSVRVGLSPARGVEGDPDESLEVRNGNYSALGIAWVAGDELPVQSGSVYTVDTRVRYRNSNWTHVAVEGYLKSREEWVQLVQCPTILSGTAGWHRWRCSFYMPEGVTAIRPMLAAGWARDTSKGPARSWFDDIRMSKVDPDYIAGLGADEPPELNWKTENPHRHVVEVKGAISPFMLVLGEAYDPLWVARVENGPEIEPARLYSTVMGFPVEKQGDYRIIIEYRPQRWFLAGLVVSSTVFVACLLFLLGWMILSKQEVAQ
jgi:hypothetical protein